MEKIISWVEIPAKDMQRAVDFYNKLLDLNLEILDWGEEKMAHFPNDEGAISMAPGFEPSSNGTLVSFLSKRKLETTLQLAAANGGKIIRDKTKIEAEGRGYFALLLDTEGNKIGLYED